MSDQEPEPDATGDEEEEEEELADENDGTLWDMAWKLWLLIIFCVYAN